jgi:hypothetical protein
MTRILKIAADGSLAQVSTGNFQYFCCRALDNPCEVSFDGTMWRTLQLNDNIGPITPTPTRAFFRALNGQAATVTFDYSNTPLKVQSTLQKNASTYSKGTVIAVGGGVVTYIPGTDNGHQRKFIIMGALSTVVQFLDANGNVMGEIGDATSQPIETDAVIAVVNKPGHGAGTVNVAEFFFA